MIVVPESALVDLLDLSQRAEDRLTMFDDTLADALRGARARVAHETRVLQEA